MPSYAATRVVIETTVESFPQSLLQSFIFIQVMRAEDPAGGSRLDDPAGGSRLADRASLFPPSILASLVSCFTAWVELVLRARWTHVSLRACMQGVWSLGAGLPLNAFKSNTIIEFKCASPLSSEQISLLIDALKSNSSCRRRQIP